VAGSLSEAESIDALAEPEAKGGWALWMKLGGTRPKGAGLDAGRRSIFRLADTPPQILVRCKRLVAG
jgi:hypothetical protein